MANQGAATEANVVVLSMIVASANPDARISLDGKMATAMMEPLWPSKVP
jgi:hypothetical protein